MKAFLSDTCRLPFLDNRLAKTVHVVREPPDVEIVVENLDGENNVAVWGRWQGDRGPGFCCTDELGG